MRSLTLSLALSFAPAAAAQAWEETAEDAPPEEAPRGLLGPLKIGPSLALGFPHVVTYGVDVSWERVLSGGLSTGTTRIGAFAPLDARLASTDLRVRFHPWRGSFFLGLGYGRQTVDATATVKDLAVTMPDGSARVVDAHFRASARSTYVLPHFGWSTVYDFGLSVGFELGAQVPLSSSSSVSGSAAGAEAAPEFTKKTKAVKNALKQASAAVLPYVTLVRFGWLF